MNVDYIFIPCHLITRAWLTALNTATTNIAQQKKIIKYSFLQLVPNTEHTISALIGHCTNCHH